MADTLVFGAGWIGTQITEHLSGAVLVRADIADEGAVAAALDEHQPKRVVNCAGKTGHPNVDACEDAPEATYRSNVAGPILLAGACKSRGTHFTHIGSGCIYTGNNGGAGFAEDDAPNFAASLYSRTKALSEAALKDLDALQLRIRMPLSSEPSSRNLLTKLLRYWGIISIPNSVTVLADFFPAATALIERDEVGVWNVVNEGEERHDELLKLYQEHVDPDHAFDVIDLAQLSERIVAGRSNCTLDTDKLRNAGLALPHVNESLPKLVKEYGAALKAAQA